MSTRMFEDVRAYGKADLAARYRSTAGTQPAADGALLARLLADVARQGFVVVPESCRAHPEDVVFLIRHPETAPFYGAFNFYGADRTITAK